jgi:hypothetical protein
MLSLMRVTLFGRAVPYARDTSVSLARIVAHLEQYYTRRRVNYPLVAEKK